MSIQQKVVYSAASFLAATASLAVTSASASAVNLTPQVQGEVNVGLGCLDECIDISAMFESIVSEVDATTGTKSRLFVDYFGADDKKETFGEGSGKVVLNKRDRGTYATQTAGFWFRPSEVSPNGGNEENGQLEVGTFTFNFVREMAELTIDFFDTESAMTTGILAINGINLLDPAYVPAGADKNVYSQTFTNVSSFTIKLGEDFAKGTGDGVNFQMSGVPSVPEPATVLGLMAIAGLGLGLKKTQQDAA